MTETTQARAKRGKQALLALLLLLLLLPALQARLRLVRVQPLEGHFAEQAPHPALRWDSLRSNRYQTGLDRYLETRLGFREGLIRLRNQLRFSLFQVSSSPFMIIGRQGVIFQNYPINTYLGEDAIDPQQVRFRVRRLRRVQQDLAERGIPLLFVLAPNKARQMANFLPAHLPHPRPGRSNYELFSAEMQRQGVELLNFTPLFTAWADTSRYALFPWGGTHWSAYGAALAADTLLGRIEHLVHAPVPRLRALGPPVVTDSARGLDGDLSQPLNLMASLKGYPAAYPRLGPAPARPAERRPNLLLVGDSFSWGLMFFSPFIQHAFAPESRLWYYNRTAFVPDSFEHKDAARSEVEKLDLRQQVESRQIVVLLVSEGNLATSEYDFTGQLFSLYHPLTAADNARIQELEQAISARQPWEDGGKPGFTQRMHELALAAYYEER